MCKCQGCRDLGGGGAVWATCPPTWELQERRPPKFGLFGLSFIFLLFLHINLGPSQKIVGHSRGVFSFG